MPTYTESVYRMFIDEIQDFTNTSTYPEFRDTRYRDNECRLYLFCIILYLQECMLRVEGYTGGYPSCNKCCNTTLCNTDCYTTTTTTVAPTLSKKV